MIATKKIMGVPMKSTIKDYLQIAKPGMIFSNLLGTIAGFCIAAREMSFNIEILNIFIMTCLGTIFVIGASAVINNIYDSDIDKFMERTKDRALTNSRISKKGAIVYAIFLIAIGEFVLFEFVNARAALVGYVGFVAYSFIYTSSKRKTVFNTEIGCISGAMPPIIGYVAVTGEVDVLAIILFVWMFFWQPPHFFALAIRRAEEYKSVGIPMLPVVKGNQQTKIHMLVYSVLMLIVSTMFYFLGFLGIWYLVISLILGIPFVAIVVRGFKYANEEEISWAKKTFGYSILYLTLMFFTMMLSPILN